MTAGQKRIEHTRRYLRASRTGGLSLRAQTRAAGVNPTGNTRHGACVSTRLAKNTQIAFLNGRFILRGRYGSDAAKFNLSKSGVTVSTKTPIGSFTWIRPGRSSSKIAGIQLRGHKAAAIQGIFAIFASVYWLFGTGVLRSYSRALTAEACINALSRQLHSLDFSHAGIEGAFAGSYRLMCGMPATYIGCPRQWVFQPFKLQFP